MDYEDPDNQDDTQMTFVGWSLTPVTQPGNPIDDYGYEVTFAPINAQGLYEVEGTVHMYPVFRWVKWLNFYTGPSGSHATYFTDTYYFADRGDSQTAGPAYAEGPVRLPGVEAYNENGLHYPAMTRDPDRQGRAYVFEGWYIGATEDQNGEVDITGATRVANADGTLIQGVDRDVFKYVATCDKNESPHFHFTNEFRYNENSNPQYRFTKEPITLYAHWTYATTASYSVVVSSLKAIPSNNDPTTLTHDQKSYEFAEKFIYTGNIGADVAWNPAFATLNNYESFNALHPDAQLTLDTDVEEGGNQYHNPYFGYIYAGTTYNFANPQTIAADGSTVIFLYYDWVTMPDPSAATPTLKFVDSMDTTATFPIVFNGVKYDAIELHYGDTLEDYLPVNPVSSISADGLKFKGWYADEACTNPVALTAADHTAHPTWTYFETMPATDLTIYAGWTRQWFLVRIDPNYGELYKHVYTDNTQTAYEMEDGAPVFEGTGSTWFWKEYGDTFQEYTTAKRDYVESDSGSWYYVKHDWAYYRYPDPAIPGSGYDKVPSESRERKTYYTKIPSEATELITFQYDPNVYRYAGWYEVYFDENGNEIGEADKRYNFESIVDHDIYLRLRWMKAGVFYLQYNAGEGDLNNQDENEVLYLELDGDTYADDADVLVTRVAEPPEGYEFVGWRIRQDDSGTIYYPGQTFHLLSKFMATVQGKRTVFLDAVYERVPTVTLVYHANGGVMSTTNLTSTVTGNRRLAYGYPEDASYIGYTTAYNTTAQTVTVSGLVNNAPFVLSDGTSWLSRDNATFAGWCEAETLNPETDTLWAGGDTCRIGANEGEDRAVHLYAMWKVDVRYHLNQPPADANFGGAWDDVDPEGNSIYILSADDATYTQQGVLIGSNLGWPPHDPVYSGSGVAQTFRGWGVYEDGTLVAYNFGTTVEGALDIYARWGTAIEIHVKLLDTTEYPTVAYAPWTQDTNNDTKPDGDAQITLTAERQTPRQLATTITTTAQTSDPAYSCAFATVEKIGVPIQDVRENPIEYIYYSPRDGKVHLVYGALYEDVYGSLPAETDVVLEDDEVLYILYYKLKVPQINYMLMEISGFVSEITNMDSAAPRSIADFAGPGGVQPKEAITIPANDYNPMTWLPTTVIRNERLDYTDTSTTPPTEYVNNNEPISRDSIQYFNYSLGSANAENSVNLNHKTTAYTGAQSESRPDILIKNTWRGLRFSQDGGASWFDAGVSDPELYVVFYTETPTVITLYNRTVGLNGDMNKLFDYDYWIEEIVYDGNGHVTEEKLIFSTRNPSAATNPDVNTIVPYTQHLMHGETFSSFTTTSAAHTYRVTYVVKDEPGFDVTMEILAGDGTAAPANSQPNTALPSWVENDTDGTRAPKYVYHDSEKGRTFSYTVTSNGPFCGNTALIVFTNTRNYVYVDLHAARADLNGNIYHTHDWRATPSSEASSDVWDEHNPYTVKIELGQTKNLFEGYTYNFVAPNYDKDYVPGALIYGHDQHTTAYHAQQEASSSQEQGNNPTSYESDIITFDENAPLSCYRLAYEKVYPDDPTSTVYDIYMKDERENYRYPVSDLANQFAKNVNGTTHTNTDPNQEVIDFYRLYYLFYPAVRVYYVLEHSDGTLTPIEGAIPGKITYDGAEAHMNSYDGMQQTLNGTQVEQGQKVGIWERYLEICQDVGRDQNGNPYFNVPPILDNGQARLDLVYYKLGASTQPLVNGQITLHDHISDFPGTKLNGYLQPNGEMYSSGVTETLRLTVGIEDHKLKWKFEDERHFLAMDNWPVVYAIYRERGYNLTVSKTVPVNTGYDEAFNVTIESMSINRDHYEVHGTGYSTIDATPVVPAANGNDGTPGRITFTVKDGDTVTIVGLGTGTYTVTESGIDNFTLTATVKNTQDNSDPTSVNVTPNASGDAGTVSDITLDNHKTLALTNTPQVICRVGAEKFYTLSSAVKYIEEHDSDFTATIEMLVPVYLMPNSDTPEIPPYLNVTITTAPKNTKQPGDVGYDATNQITTDAPAIIKRKSNLTGPMFRNLGVLTFNNVTLDGNIRRNASDEIVPYTSPLIQNEGTLNIADNATLENAVSNGQGGAVYGYKGAINVTGGLIENCSAQEGGAIYVASGTLSVSGGTMQDNTAEKGGAIYYAGSDTVTIRGGIIGESGHPNQAEDGGAIYMASGTINVTSGHIEYNVAEKSGGAIYALNAYVNVSGTGNETSKYPHISNNTAGENGGAVCMQTLTFKLTKGYIQNNTAANGGVVWSNTGSVEISGGEVSGNQAIGALSDPTDQNSPRTGGLGGAVYTNESAFSMTGGQILNNTANEHGGAVYAEVGSVTYTGKNGGLISGNVATTGSGGGIYAATSAVTMSDNARLIGNTALSGNGGALYVGSGAASLTSAQIGKPSSGDGTESDGNKAVNGSGVFVNTGSMTINGGQIRNNVASDGGAVGVGSADARLYFQNNLVIRNNTMTVTGSSSVPSNVYLNFDTDAILNFESLGGSADVGIYVSDDAIEGTDETVLERRGVPSTRFGVYVNNNVVTNMGKIHNDRTDNLIVKEDTTNKKLYWVRNFHIKVYYVADYTRGLPFGNTDYTTRSSTPFYEGNSVADTSNSGRFIRKADGTPPSFENAASEVADNIRRLGAVAPTGNQTAVFGNAFVQGESVASMSYADYLTRIDWSTGDNLWHFTKRDGQDLLDGSNTSTTKTLIFIFTEPYYLSIENNHSTDTLVIEGLTVKVNGVDTPVINSATQTGYGYVFAKNDAIQDVLLPVEASDLVLLPGHSIRILLPGGKNMPYTLTGKYYTAYNPSQPENNVAVEDPDDPVRYDRRLTTVPTTMVSEKTPIDVAGFSINGDGTDNKAVTPSQSGLTHEIVFYSDRQICRVVVDNQITDTSTGSSFVESGFVAEHAGVGATEGKWEYTFRSPKQANAFITAHHSAFYPNGDTTTVKATIELLTDYMLPQSERVELQTGGGIKRDITFQTALDGHFRYKQDQVGVNGYTLVNGAETTTKSTLRATVSRGPANNESFIKAPSGTLTGGDYVDKLTVKNLIFDGKNFGGDNISGGIIKTNGWNVEIDNVEFRNCRAKFGGGIYIESVNKSYSNKKPYGSLKVQDSTFINCQSTYSEDKYGGGGIWTSMKDVTITGCTFDTCEGVRQGGGLFHYLGGNFESNTTVTNCDFINCRSQAAGSMESGAKYVTVTGCNFKNSTASERNGGALNVWALDQQEPTADCYVVLDSCTFENCYCLNGTGNNGNGGAMRSTATYNTIRNCTFTNALGNNGGAINIFNKNAKVTVVFGCSFNGCSARDKGGALYCRSKLLYIGVDPDDDTITGATGIRNCMAPNEGGAIYHSRGDNGSELSMKDATIDTCYSSTKGGGGVYTNAKTVSVTDSTVENCYTAASAQNGGGLYLANSSTTTFSGATIRNNTATGMGGGVFHNAKGTFTVTSTGAGDTFRRSLISGNIAQGVGDVDKDGATALNNSGGGIYTKAVTFTLQNTTVSDNQAAGNGGGICQNNATNGSLMIVDGATVTGNISGGKGGGLFTLANMKLKGITTITGNRLSTETEEDAAGVYLRGDYDAPSTSYFNGPVSLYLGETGGTKARNVFNITGNLTVDGKNSNLRLPDHWDSTEGEELNDKKVQALCDIDGEVRVVNAKKKLTQFGFTGDNFANPAGFTDEHKVFWSDDGSLYGIVDRQDPNGKRIIWGGDPICKITDGNGRLLYIYIDEDHMRDAVFDRLDALTATHSADTTTTSAFSTLRMLDYSKDPDIYPGTRLYYADGTPYNDQVFQVKMLIEDYDCEYYVDVPGGSGRTVTLTTAGEKDSLYPYRGRPGTYCTITRDPRMDTNQAMITAKANFTVTNITLDGNRANVNDGVPGASTRIITADYGSAQDILITLGRKANLQNAATTDNGGGVYVNNGAQLYISGGAIRNCAAANGGGVYIDGAKGAMVMSAGTITKCEATVNGGGVYFNKGQQTLDANDNPVSGYMKISGGSISRCTAVDGGGVYMNGGNVANGFSRQLYMSGGSIAQNSVTGNGGGIVVGDDKARIYFSGAPYVYQNTSSSATTGAMPPVEGEETQYYDQVYAHASNLYMDQAFSRPQDIPNNPHTVILSRGLVRGASIGVYVPGENHDSGLYGDHGAEADPFATFEGVNGASGMNYFINDRNGMKGGRLDDQNESDMKIYWRKIWSLSVTKMVLSDDPADLDANNTYRFEMQLSGTSQQGVRAEDFNGVYGGLNFTAGRAIFALKNGETRVIDLLPLGFDYTVTELIRNDQVGHFKTSAENDQGDVSQQYNTEGNPYTTGSMNKESKFNYPVTFYNLHAICKIVGVRTDDVGNEQRELLYVYDNDTAKYVPAVYSELVTAFNRVNAEDTIEWWYKGPSGWERFYAREYSIEMLVSQYDMTKPAGLINGKIATLTTAAKDADDGFPYVGGADSQGHSIAAKINRAYTGESLFTVSGGAKLTLGSITLDGKGSSYPVAGSRSGNDGKGDMVLVKNTGSLTVGTGVTLQNAKTSNRAAAVYLEQGGKMYISGAPVFTNNVNTSGDWLNQNGQTSTVKKNGGDESYYLDNGSYRIPMDIYIAGYEGATATSLVVTGNITSPDGSIAIWAQKTPHYLQNQQFALMDDNAPEGGYTGLTAFRNDYADWQSKNPLAGEPKYLYGVARDGMVYWSGSMDLIVSKTVDGDFAMPDQQFEFTVVVDLTGLAADHTTYEFDYKLEELVNGVWTQTGAGKLNIPSGQYNSETKRATLQTFSLKNGERIRISIPRGLETVSVTETPVGGYQTQYQVDGDSPVQNNVMGTPIQMEADTLVAFTNVSIPPAPTGSRFSMMPFVLMMVAGMALPAVLPRRRRRKKEED